MMPEPQPPAGTTSFTPSRRTSRSMMALSAVGVLALLSGATLLLNAVGLIDFNLKTLFSDSDEAPIRVRNGSLDFTIVGGQRWEQVGGSGNWRIKNATRHREEFEVTIAVRTGATCGGALTATGSDIVLVYENDDNAGTTNTSKIVLQSAGRRTMVKPDSGVTMTWDNADGQKLSYQVSGGYLQSIAVGNGGNPATICSFSSRAQLDHMLILNVP